MKQREIKFRAWDKENNCMYEWDVLSKRNNFMEALEMNKENLWELMQYTGLKDRKGKKIWEGDIVRVLYSGWPSKPEDDKRTLEEYLVSLSSVGRVIYQAPKFVIDFGKRKYWDNNIGSFNVDPYGFIEVIGNVYSNPELLEEKEEL